MTKRWRAFSKILDNPRENFKFSLYRSQFTKAELARTQAETIEFILSDVSIWTYPEEKLEHYLEGKIYQVETIFLIKPNIRVLQNDLLLKHGEKRLHRVLGVRDMKSHLEVHTNTSDRTSKWLLERTAVMGAACSIATPGLPAFRASVVFET